MTILIAADETVKTKVIDRFSKEEYVLHRMAGAAGPFVGAVRSDHETILRDISEKCFEPDVFKSDYARQVIQYVHDTYHDELEFLWQRFPDNAVFRRKDSGKWYGALLIVSKIKLGLESDDVVEILDLRIQPESIDPLLDGKIYLPGYHMNKKHWYTVCLDGSIPIDEILRRIDDSYELAKAGK